MVCCTEYNEPGWRWIEPNLADMDVKFLFVSCVPRNIVEKKGPVNLSRIRGSFEAVLLARRMGAQALVAHLPRPAAWCAFMARAFGLKIPIVAHVFNFPVLPRLVWRPLFSLALSRVDRFVVHSTLEKQVYAKFFGLPVDKFDVVLWGVRPPEVESAEVPLETGDYISVIGQYCRDYRVLLEAARRLPDLRFVIVARPDNLSGLDVPPNVFVRPNLPFQKTMNVLLHSRFMVLPLIGSEVPAGHVTLVAAMHLGKAVVISDSAGVRDYVRDGENAVIVPVGSIESLVVAIRRLWDDHALCVKLGKNAQLFAARNCSEECITEHFRGWLIEHRIGSKTGTRQGIEGYAHS